jgi:hypothetical protein
MKKMWYLRRLIKRPIDNRAFGIPRTHAFLGNDVGLTMCPQIGQRRALNAEGKVALGAPRSLQSLRKHWYLHRGGGIIKRFRTAEPVGSLKTTRFAANQQTHDISLEP